MSEWKPIESAPRDGRAVLLDNPIWLTRVVRGAWDKGMMEWRVDSYGRPANKPKYWMPLPPPPEVEG